VKNKLLRMLCLLLLLALSASILSCENEIRSSDTLLETQGNDPSMNEDLTVTVDPSQPPSSPVEPCKFVRGNVWRLMPQGPDSVIKTKEGMDKSVNFIFGSKSYRFEYKRTKEYPSYDYSWDFYEQENGWGELWLSPDDTSFRLSCEDDPIARNPVSPTDSKAYVEWVETYMEKYIYGWHPEKYTLSCYTYMVGGTRYDGFYVPEDSSERVLQYGLRYDIYVGEVYTGERLIVSLKENGDVVGIHYWNRNMDLESIDVDFLRRKIAGYNKDQTEDNTDFYLYATKQGIMLYAEKTIQPYYGHELYLEVYRLETVLE